jgi:cytochrome P450
MFENWHIRRNILGIVVHVVTHPDAVQRVLQTNAANYAKPDIVKRVIAPMIGLGLLSSDDDLWREQRRIVAASFAPPAVDALIPDFVRAATDRMDSWEPGSVRDMAAEATVTTMTVIADTLFGGDPRLTTETAMDHIAAALKASAEARLSAVLRLPPLGWNQTMRAGQRGQVFLRSILAELVQERAGRPDGDFLDRLIHALKERFPEEEATALALDNAATFYLAGHETTANALTWTVYLLSEQPELQDQAAEEARKALALGSGDPALIDGLRLLRRILEESMRLYPPVPRFDRQALAADTLAEAAIAPGDIISIWPWIIHRHKKLWDDADAFDADRVLPERKAALHRFQYVPFGGGPRVCVGARFATTEALVILAHWLADWRFERAVAGTVRVVGTVTLRPEGGLPLRLSRH